MRFSDFPLDGRLQRAIAEAGFKAPTPVQVAALPPALEGRDVIGTAQTGTGKTAAFVLPLLQRLISSERVVRHPRALIVSPTRELAEQTHACVRRLGRYADVSSAAIYGGVPMEPQVQALRRGTDVIVACPGRLLDHAGRGDARLDAVEALVLDEADMMLDMGFLPSVNRIIAMLPRDRQTMMFSATFPPDMRALAGGAMHDPVRVDSGPATPPATVSDAFYPVPAHLKTALLFRLLDDAGGAVLVFTRTRRRADRLARQAQRAGYSAAVLHSDRSQAQRNQAMEGFRRGRYPLLVATDIAARGLDVARVSRVINYDVPDGADAYIHRIGRTGRAQRKGDAATLVTSEDSAVVREIERTLGRRIEKRVLAGFDYRAPAPAR